MSLLVSTGILRVFILALALGAVLLGNAANAAEEAPAGVGSREIWVGADAGAHNWLVYSGSTYAPWGDIHQDGFRMRATTGYGHYDYQLPSLANPNKLLTVKATKTYSDAMIGYQTRFGELTAKAFVGMAILNNIASPVDRRARSDLSIGVKGSVELWLNLGSQAWTSLDVSYADTQETASIRSRIGYRILPTVSVGAEAVINHAKMFDSVQTKSVDDGRVGLFARYEWFGGEISASGGVTGDLHSVDEIDLLKRPSAYGTLNLIVQF